MNIDILKCSLRVFHVASQLVLEKSLSGPTVELVAFCRTTAVSEVEGERTWREVEMRNGGEWGGKWKGRKANGWS